MRPVKVRVRNTDAMRSLRRSLERVNQHNVQYGYFEEQGIHGPSGLSYVALMYIHEIQGIPSKNGLVLRQPFQTATYVSKDTLANSVNSGMRNYFKEIAVGKGTVAPQKAMEDFGRTGLKVTKDIFGSSRLTPNAPSTVAKKGGRNTPLIDTGELMENMRYRTTADNQLKG